LGANGTSQLSARTDIIQASSFLCFDGAILASFQENLVAIGSESWSPSRESGSDATFSFISEPAVEFFIKDYPVKSLSPNQTFKTLFKKNLKILHI
jgi:hypothetical protein